MDMLVYLFVIVLGIGASDRGGYDYDVQPPPVTDSPPVPDPQPPMDVPIPPPPMDEDPGDEGAGDEAPDGTAPMPLPPQGDMPNDIPGDGPDSPMPAPPMPAPPMPTPPGGDQAGPPADDQSAAPAPPPGDFAAEDQTPTGKMTTATEVRPILTVTKPQWVAVRDYDNKDLLYFTNLLAWRCGLLEITYSVNGGPSEPLKMEPCHEDEATPNALHADDVLPYVALPAGAVTSVEVEILYDDLGTDSASYQREEIRM